jgi:tRNA1Val (adenine37-N6)-methyltransferase
MPRRQKSTFHFKQFTVNQDKCAMKVGTDSILLGSWVRVPANGQILDIGTGTGLLALMLAQRSPSVLIDAVEIDYSAYLQALENVHNSPWGDRIKVYHSSIQDFTNEKLEVLPKVELQAFQYDLIIANPPFFEKAYKAPQKARTLARHSDSLLQSDILQIAQKLLKPSGFLAVVYPTDLANAFMSNAEAFNLFGDRQLSVKPNPQNPVKRILLELKKGLNKELNKDCHFLQESQITIEESKHIYTADYIALVKDFYLNM